MSARKFRYLCVVLILMMSCNNSIADDALKSTLKKEFIESHSSELLNEIWNEMFSFNYSKEYSIVEVGKKSSSGYWLVYLTDKRVPDKEFTRKFLSRLVGQEYFQSEVTDAELGKEPIRVKMKIEDTCPETIAQLKDYDKAGYDTVYCVSPQEEKENTEKKLKDNNSYNVNCEPGYWLYNRYDTCGLGNMVLNIINVDSGQIIGKIYFSVTQTILLEPKSRIFSEWYDVAFTSAIGQWAGSTFYATVSCSGVCSSSSNLPYGYVVRVPSTIQSNVTYRNAVVSVHNSEAHYELWFGPVTLNGAVWNSPAFRCDAIVGGSYGAGCVFPEYKPTIYTMTDSRIPAITANIRSVQDLGPNHYGQPSIGLPIHRTTDAGLYDANRKAACPPSGPKPSDNYNCDEYPFASTYEGASRSSYLDWGSRWVPKQQNDIQGGLLGSFYGRYRILDGDAFWVNVSY